MKKLIILFFVQYCLVLNINAQCAGGACNSMTYFFVDNSSGYKADALNEEMLEELKSNLKRIALKGDNYFFFYGTDGEEPKNSTNINSFLSGTTLKSYLNKESKDSDNNYDLKMLRQLITDDKPKVKQTVEVYLFLSYNALKKIIKAPEEMPAALFFTREMPIYLSNNNLETKINLFVNKEIIAEFSEKSIIDFFTFCNNEINLKNSKFDLKLF